MIIIAINYLMFGMCLCANMLKLTYKMNGRAANFIETIPIENLKMFTHFQLIYEGN